jgi:hypothetical protein
MVVPGFRKLGFLSACALALGADVNAQENADNDRAKNSAVVDDIGVELLNPIGSLFPIYNDFNYQAYQGDLPGADDQSFLNWTVTAAYPFKFSNGRNLVLRASIPLDIAEPTYRFYDTDEREYTEWQIRLESETLQTDGTWFDVHGHLSDIRVDAAYGGTNENGFISMFGIVTVLPTSQDLSGSSEQYLLGPEFALGQVTDWGIYGGWLTQLTNVTDGRSDVDADTNLTELKFFFGYNLDNGWQIISNPVVTYDWEAPSDNQLFVPIGGGVARTVQFGRVPVRFALEGYYFIESPDFYGPNWNVRFSITPVVSGFKH